MMDNKRGYVYEHVGVSAVAVKPGDMSYKYIYSPASNLPPIPPPQ